jgi:hypothetical protein
MLRFRPNASSIHEDLVPLLVPPQHSPPLPMPLFSPPGHMLSFALTLLGVCAILPPSYEPGRMTHYLFSISHGPLPISLPPSAPVGSNLPCHENSNLEIGCTLALMQLCLGSERRTERMDSSQQHTGSTTRTHILCLRHVHGCSNANSPSIQRYSTFLSSMLPILAR